MQLCTYNVGSLHQQSKHMVAGKRDLTQALQQLISGKKAAKCCVNSGTIANYRLDKLAFKAIEETITLFRRKSF